MRILKINNQIVDLSPDTAIGINYRKGNISDVDKKLFDSTNNFTCPLTPNNAKILQFASSPFANSSIPYEKVEVDYWDNNIQLINKGIGYITIKQTTFTITVLFDGEIVNTLKAANLREIMRAEYTPIIGASTIEDLISFIRDSEPLGICMASWYYEDREKSNSSLYDMRLEGNFAIKLSKVMEMIEDNLGYNIVMSGSVTDNADFQNLVMPFYDLIMFGISSTSYGVYLYDATAITSAGYDPLISSTFDYMADITAMDFIKAVSLMFNCIIDIDTASKNIKITPVSDILETTEILDWSGKTISFDKFFKFGTYAQSTYLQYTPDTYTTVEDGQVGVFTDNVNIETSKTVNINVCASNYVIASGETDFYYTSIGGLTNSQPEISDTPLTNLVIMERSEKTNTRGHQQYCYYLDSGGTITKSYFVIVSIQKVKLYDFGVNYTAFQEVIDRPLGYNAVMNLTSLDMLTFDQTKLVKINELGGTFYVNTIKGYNSLSKQGTKVELLKVK